MSVESARRVTKLMVANSRGRQRLGIKERRKEKLGEPIGQRLIDLIGIEFGDAVVPKVERSFGKELVLGKTLLRDSCRQPIILRRVGNQPD